MKNKFIIFSVLGILCTNCATKPKAINKDDIRPVIRDHLKEIRTCYEATLERNSKIEGKLVVKWQINQEGKVANFAPVKESSTITDERLIQCIGDAFATWQFSLPPDNIIAEILYPFYFRPDSEVMPTPTN